MTKVLDTSVPVQSNTRTTDHGGDIAVTSGRYKKKSLKAQPSEVMNLDAERLTFMSFYLKNVVDNLIATDDIEIENDYFKRFMKRFHINDKFLFESGVFDCDLLEEDHIYPVAKYNGPVKHKGVFTVNSQLGKMSSLPLKGCFSEPTYREFFSSNVAHSTYEGLTGRQTLASWFSLPKCRLVILISMESLLWEAICLQWGVPMELLHHFDTNTSVLYLPKSKSSELETTVREFMKHSMFNDDDYDDDYKNEKGHNDKSEKGNYDHYKY